jgi:predicted acetyltransferase
MLRNDRNHDLVIRAVESDDEIRLANDLMAKGFNADYFSSLHWLETCGAGYPGFRREHTRVAMSGNDLAGALRLTTETIRLGEARLRTGGLAWVTTSPRHRQRGVCRALMFDTFNYMRQRNYHLAMLFGIPNFYHRFGFATTLADYSIIMDAEELLAAPLATRRVREAKPGDIPAIQRIHAANDADVACSLLRSSAHITNKWDHRCKGMRVLTNDQGKVLAYFLARKDGVQLTVNEIGVSDMALCGDILTACARYAADEAVARIHFLVPPPHPFARFLLLYTSTHQMRIVRDCGGMMAFVDVAEALENLIPEWESLLAKSSLREDRIEVTLVVDKTYHRVRANRGAIDVSQFPGKNRLGLTPADLMHLVTGYRYIEDILAAKRHVITAEARALLAVLFPKRTPYVWPFDRF